MKNITTGTIISGISANRQISRLMALALVLFTINSSNLFAANVSFTGATGGNWNEASNWSNGVLPTADDFVTISGKVVFILSGDNAVAGQIALMNSGANTVGTLNVMEGGILTLSSTTLASVYISIQGGTLNNAGTVTLYSRSTQTTAPLWIRASSGSSTKMPSTVNNTGTLTVDVTDSGNNSACVVMSQNDAGVAPTINLGGGSLVLKPKPTTSAFVFDIQSDNALITGTGTITLGTTEAPIAAVLVRLLTATANSFRKMTIDENITINYVGSNYGIQLYSSGVNLGSATLINKGILNLSGTSKNPIFFNSLGSNADTFLKFENSGTINATGSPAPPSSGVVVFAGSGKSIFDNSGELNFNPTTDGSLISTGNHLANVTITNSGLMTVGSSIPLYNSIIMGGSGTSLTNTGSIFIETGAIIGRAGKDNAFLYNNTGGTLDLTNTANDSTLVGNTAISVINNGGTLNTGATANTVMLHTGTPGVSFVSGTFNPGGNGKGLVTISNSVALGGTINLNVTGTASPGIDYDQIVSNVLDADVNVSAVNLTVSMGALTPEAGTAIDLIKSTFGTVTGTLASVSGLADKWSVVYAPNSVRLVYNNTTGITTGVEKSLVQNSMNGLLSTTDGTLQIFAVTGKLVKTVKVVPGQAIVVLPGAYIVRLTSETGTFFQKVII